MSIRQRQPVTVLETLVRATSGAPPAPLSILPGEPVQDDDGTQEDDGTMECPTCDGEGTILDGNRVCPACGGKGQVPDAHVVDAPQPPSTTSSRSVAMSVMPPADAS